MVTLLYQVREVSQPSLLDLLLESQKGLLDDFETFLLVIALQVCSSILMGFFLGQECIRSRESVAADEMGKRLNQSSAQETAPGNMCKISKRAVVLKQSARRFVHMVQFSIRYCVMLLFLFKYRQDR